MKTHVEKIVENLYVLRIDDNSTRYFEALWYIPEGITYNAYILTTSEGSILFDTWKKGYDQVFLDAVTRVVDPKDIKYVVIHHAEPDHTGLLPTILDLLKNNVTILGHPLAKNMIKAFYNIRVENYRPVSDLGKLAIGNFELRFIHTPWIHWPETIMTYINNLGVLLSCDAFGGYSIPPGLFDDEIDTSDYLRFVKKYVITVVGHYRQKIIDGIEKLRREGITPRIIAPSHGIIWRTSPSTIVDYYMSIARGESSEDKIVVIYGSMYGTVEEYVRKAVELLEAQGFKTIVFRFTSQHQDSVADLLGEIADAKALIIGAATYEAGIFPRIKHVIEDIVWKAPSNKPVLILSSYGWGGVAGRKIREVLEKAGFEIVDVVESKGCLTESLSRRIREAVGKLIDSVRK